VIRRAFWLGAGAAAGIMGYRRVSAMGRKVSGRVTARGAIGMARETARFARDVREGRDLYIARHNQPAPSTLRPRTATPEALAQKKDGR
jgi:hypothetical protein